MNQFVKNVTPSEAFPPIVLQCQRPTHCFGPTQLVGSDSFSKDDKNNKVTNLYFDPNDRFEFSSDSENGDFYNTTLAAGYNSREAKALTKEGLKWIKRLWAAAEFYDTVDSYVDRFNRHPSEDV